MPWVAPMSSVTKKRQVAVKRAQSGFTLLEALVSALILAVGIMGIMSLLSFSKVSQHESIQRTRAVALAADILERIRRNPQGMPVYNIGLSDPVGGGTREPATEDPASAEPASDCRSAACTVDELANHDLRAWERLLDGRSAVVTNGGAPTVGMRNVSACVEFTADSGRNHTGIVNVIIQWEGLQKIADAVNGGTVCGNKTEEDLTRRQVVLNSYVIDETEL